ncbi:nucleotide-diphospho-sugar transferase [Anaeromyces robustus]|uniref:Nucleotide-diphospho-sugar transferase n=1 Tax=Anaeromyces robustus TaxID=1754192 RepID=A0A1Y1XJB1_9FUNG|nr:nucleotide-diphospho-sugar transferase [Anaeromyces robustus]|eukprot:ORX85838.1 nucleotide-diphospho-sugar transferase [Anaeromyces robustus]
MKTSSLDNVNKYDSGYEIEDFSLEEVITNENENDNENENEMEETLLEKSMSSHGNKKIKRSKSNSSKRSRIIKIILLIFIISLIIEYIGFNISNKDVNDKLRKYVKIEPTDDLDNYEHWNNTTNNKNAFLIMLTSEGESVDNYYMYTSAIVYRLLHKEEIRTKRNDVDVVVMVTEDVADWKLRGLHNLGAVIKRVHKITMDSAILKNKRWKNCYTKLQMFEMTEYETIVYLDADLFIKKNIDELFDIANDVRNKTGRNDFFGAVTDGPIRDMYNHKENKGMLNAGIMILTPEVTVYNDLLELAPRSNLYNAMFMEQGLLSLYYTDDDNLFNRTRYHLDPRYNAQWLSDSNMEFYDKVYVIHQKLGKVEKAKSQQVQKDIFYSIVEWIQSVNKDKKITISYD